MDVIGINGVNGQQQPIKKAEAKQEDTKKSIFETAKEAANDRAKAQAQVRKTLKKQLKKENAQETAQAHAKAHADAVNDVAKMKEAAKLVAQDVARAVAHAHATAGDGKNIVIEALAPQIANGTSITPGQLLEMVDEETAAKPVAPQGVARAVAHATAGGGENIDIEALAAQIANETSITPGQLLEMVDEETGAKILEQLSGNSETITEETIQKFVDAFVNAKNKTEE